LDSYTLKVDGLIQNESIIFEPHFMDNENFYISELNFKNFDLEFSKDFQLKEGEYVVYENFKWNISNFNKINVRVFNFLRVPTIYYPYNCLKNAAESTYFTSIEMNVYDYLLSKSGDDIETNYQLIGKLSQEKYRNFIKTEYSKLYDVSNSPNDIANNFMNLFSMILDFCFYFLIAILVLVIILFLYTIYLMILKNHKEIALLRTFGATKKSINFTYCSEVSILYIISFLFAFGFTFLTYFLLNMYVVPALDIRFSLEVDIKLTLLIFVIGLFIVNLLTQIPLIKVNSINIRKELNSL
jgi:ABC-type antimicrobial peptide transport system permease subunit